MAYDYDPLLREAYRTIELPTLVVEVPVEVLVEEPVVGIGSDAGLDRVIQG